MLKAKICITLKKTVLDPQGLAIKHALESMGHRGLADVRVGKTVDIKFNHQRGKNARRQIEEMCRTLLANPIIEDYHFKIGKA